jgi:hypothetical protein
MDYLSAQSSLLRGLFGGASPLDLINNTTGSSSTPESRSLRQWIVPPNRIPRTLPCSPDHPVIFLPIPDPSSFQLLVHWMYFGSTKPIEQALNSGAVTWEGLARNVEYLDIRSDIRVFLGRWYGKWRMHGLTRRPGGNTVADDTSDSSDSDDDDEDMFSSVASSSAFDTDPDADDEYDSEEEDDKHRRLRGRNRNTRTIQKPPPASLHPRAPRLAAPTHRATSQ